MKAAFREHGKEVDTTKDMDSIYREYSGIVTAYLMRLCGNEDLAHELTQETFYQAIRSIHRFDGKSSVCTWLCSIARHLYQKWCMTVLNQTPDEIRQGTPDHFSILWRDGDMLPDASEEMETYFALGLRAEYWSRESYPEMDEGKAPPSPVRWQELEEARQAVPEWQ